MLSHAPNLNNFKLGRFHRPYRQLWHWGSQKQFNPLETMQSKWMVNKRIAPFVQSDNTPFVREYSHVKRIMCTLPRNESKPKKHLTKSSESCPGSDKRRTSCLLLSLMKGFPMIAKGRTWKHGGKNHVNSRSLLSMWCDKQADTAKKRSPYLWE